MPLDEYGIADRAHEINLAAARIAREVADDYSTPDRPRFVAGSIGPGHQVRRRSARSASPSCATPTRSRRRGLLEGGVDLLLIETQFDLLGVKAAMIGCPPGDGRRSAARCRSRSR